MASLTTGETKCIYAADLLERRKVRSTNASGYIGVSKGRVEVIDYKLQLVRGGYKAQITIKGNVIGLGLFDTRKQADAHCDRCSNRQCEGSLLLGVSPETNTNTNCCYGYYYDYDY